MKDSVKSSANNSLNLFLVYGIVAILGLTASLFVQYQATPFWSCESVYGTGFYAASCFRMAFTMFVFINGVVVFLGVFCVKWHEEKIMRFLS